MDLPDNFELLKAQHEDLAKLLSQAYNQGHSQFKPRWEDEDGSPQQTLIMKDLLANRRFYKGTDCF